MLTVENAIGKSGNARNDHARSQKQRNNALSEYFPQNFNLQQTIQAAKWLPDNRTTYIMIDS